PDVGVVLHAEDLDFHGSPFARDRGRAPRRPVGPPGRRNISRGHTGANRVAKPRGPYSAPSERTGSAASARRAGIQHATSAAPERSAATAPSVTGSVGSTPYRTEASARAATREAPSPAPTPIRTSASPWRSIIPRTRSPSAPRAIRIPISRVRRRAACAV